MKKLFVVCTLGCVFACGAKNRAGDDTTSDDAIKTPAQWNKRPRSWISQRSRSWTLRSLPTSDMWLIFLISQQAL